MAEADASAAALRWTISAAASAALAPLNSTMIAVALPEMGAALGAPSMPLRHALVTSYLLTGVVLQSVGGRLADRIGYRRALRLGQAGFVLASCVGVAWPAFFPLTAARVLMAAAGAVVVPSALALLRNELPPERQGRAFGAFGAVMSLSAAVGPRLGALIVAELGWRAIFAVNVPWLIGCVALAGASVGVPPGPRRAAASSFDWLGALLLGSSLSALVAGSQVAALRLCMLAGALGLAGFVSVELRARAPLIDLRLFSRAAFTAGALCIALHNLAMYSLLFELPQVAGRLLGAPPGQVGGVLSAMMVSMVVTAPIAGRLSERYGPRVLCLLGSAGGALGVVWLGVSGLGELSVTLPGLILLGLGLGCATGPSQAAAMSAVPREQSGAAAGITSTLRYLGGIAGLAVLGALLGDGRAPDVVLHEHRAALTVFGAALVVATVCAVALPDRASRDRLGAAATPKRA